MRSLYSSILTPFRRVSLGAVLLVGACLLLAGGCRRDASPEEAARELALAECACSDLATQDIDTTGCRRQLAADYAAYAEKYTFRDKDSARVCAIKAEVRQILLECGAE